MMTARAETAPLRRGGDGSASPDGQAANDASFGASELERLREAASDAPVIRLVNGLHAASTPV